MFDGHPSDPATTRVRNTDVLGLEAALNPVDGTWIYWVVVNPLTGETKFASTYADHQKNVAEFQAWCQANKGKC